MFSHPRRHFSKFTCPESSCHVLNCIFSHRKRPIDASVTPSDQPPAKRSKNEPTAKDPAAKDSGLLLPQAVEVCVIDRPARLRQLRRLATYYTQLGVATPNRQAMAKEKVMAAQAKTINEYHQQLDEFLGTTKKQPQQDVKLIMPKTCPGGGGPATLPQRKKYIELLVAAVLKFDPQWVTPKKWATDVEFTIAKTSSKSTYPHLIKRKLFDTENGRGLLDLLGPNPLSPATMLEKLNKYVIDEETLVKFGYQMTVPTPSPQPSYQRTCRRCEASFLMKDHLKPTSCKYHPGKIKRRDGPGSSRFYECCGTNIGEASGLQTCSESTHHVFHFDGPEELAWVTPFLDTADWTHQAEFTALGVDCEMGYTTMGYEMLRVTAVDFITGETVLDVHVRPKGTVIDLNTQWSGVLEIPEDALLVDGVIELLKTLMNNDTILVGHGLENDVRTLRLVHHRVVDTAILFPPHKPTPRFRHSLKDLLFEYLARRIQLGEHDSAEDAVALIDIVKHFIRKGWLPVDE